MSPKAAPTKRRLFIAAVALGIIGAAALVFAKPVHKRKPPGKVIAIKDCKKKKKVVHFNHKNHLKHKKLGITCRTCHHDVKGKRAMKPHCGDCHKKATKKTGTCFKSSKKKNPFHIRCIGCHKKNKGKVKKIGPTKCKGCHQK